MPFSQLSIKYEVKWHFSIITDVLLHCLVDLIQTMQLSVYDRCWHALLPLVPCLYESKHSVDQEGEQPIKLLCEILVVHMKFKYSPGSL